MALQGTLDSFSLPDVLRLLADTGKTGRLQVEGDRGQGNVWIDDGSVVAADADGAADNASPDEVLFEMLRFDSGSFAFAAGKQSPNGGKPVDLERALRRAGELLDEWRELEAVVPSLEHQVMIAPKLTVDQVTIDASRWTTLVAVGGGLSVGELGGSLDQSELSILRTVSDLVELGIVVVQEPSKTSRRGSSSRRPRRDAGELLSGRVSMQDPTRQGQTEEPPRRAVPSTNGRSREVPAPESKPEKHTPAPSRASDRTSKSSERVTPASPVLNRRSRFTGQRSSRQLGGHAAAAAHGAPVPAMPSASPFSNDSVMPPQPGLLGPVGGGSNPPSGQYGQQGMAGLPPFDNNESQGLLPGSLDTGPLGPSPLGPAPLGPLPGHSETGQVPVVAASSLPADLSWAAEDDEAPLGGRPVTPAPLPPAGPQSPPMGSPPAPVGRSGAPLLQSGRAPLGAPEAPPGPPPLAEGEIAPHVAVLSPEARMAVETTVGPGGGGSGVVPAAGATPEEVQQRGALLGFLSSVRH